MQPGPESVIRQGPPTRPLRRAEFGIIRIEAHLWIPDGTAIMIVDALNERLQRRFIRLRKRALVRYASCSNRFLGACSVRGTGVGLGRGLGLVCQPLAVARCDGASRDDHRSRIFHLPHDRGGGGGLAGRLAEHVERYAPSPFPQCSWSAGGGDRSGRNLQGDTRDQRVHWRGFRRSIRLGRGGGTLGVPVRRTP